MKKLLSVLATLSIGVSAIAGSFNRDVPVYDMHEGPSWEEIINKKTEYWPNLPLIRNGDGKVLKIFKTDRMGRFLGDGACYNEDTDSFTQENIRTYVCDLRYGDVHWGSKDKDPNECIKGHWEIQTWEISNQQTRLECVQWSRSKEHDRCLREEYKTYSIMPNGEALVKVNGARRVSPKRSRNASNTEPTSYVKFKKRLVVPRCN